MIAIEELRKAMIDRGDFTWLNLKVKPAAGKDELIDVQGDRLRVSVKAPAREGKANKAVIDLIAKTFSVSKASVTLVSGDRSKLKTVKIEAGLNHLIEVLKKREK